MTNEKNFHPRSLHNGQYEFDILIKKNPKLAPFVKKNAHGDLGVDFADANAVLALNQSLLGHHYEVTNWSIPKGHLCPPIPSRADYLHYIADLLAEGNNGEIPKGPKIKGLDIGTGTSCIYPILGNSIYGWKFVGTDIDGDALNHAKTILNGNQTLKKNIKTRFQKSADNILKNIIKADEKFDFTMCNPPFYASLEEANSASDRKVKNLNANKQKKGLSQNLIKKNQPSNFGGQKAELWCPGGEVEFIKKMITESFGFKTQCTWFTTLVSNKEHLAEFYKLLKKINCTNVRTIEMHHGKKISHLLAWGF